MTVKEKLNLYFKLIENQFNYGGEKYAVGYSDKEATDILCESHGYRGLFWVMNKYVIRFRNKHLEKDLLKIGCFCYILWLKRGFHIISSGIDSPILSTNLEVKKNNFIKFQQFIEYQNRDLLNISSDIKDDDISDDEYLNTVEESLKRCSTQTNWENIGSYSVDIIFINVFHVWQRNFANNKEHNEDIGNQTNEKNRKN